MIAELAPTFLLIGSIKSGTTSLFRYLGDHPDVFAPDRKEPNFFSAEGRDPSSFIGQFREPVSTWAAYLELFRDARPDQARGEGSISYFYAEGVIDRVLDRIPDVRLLVLLRHPVEATWSAHIMDRRQWNERRPLEELLDEEPRAPATPLPYARGVPVLLRRGLYHAHLARWLERVPRSQLAVLFYDDLRADPNGLVRRALEHIGVDPAVEVSTDERFNVGTLPKSYRLHRVIHYPGPGLLRVKRVVRRVPGVRAARQVADGWNRNAPPALPTAMRTRLLEYYRDDTLALQDLVGRDLSAWLR